MARAATEDLYWTKVDRSGGLDACWPWRGSVTPEGYGSFWDGTRLVKAHRYIVQAEPGIVVDHDCHNRSGCTEVPCQHRRCCNPAHLVPRTQSENSILGNSGDHQSAKTHCPAGHPYDESNTKMRSVRNRRPSRLCITCNRAAQARYNAKRKAAR